MRPAKPERSWRLRILVPLLILATFMLVATSGYYLIDRRYTWSDATYMTFITVATVGYTEVHPLSGAGRIWTVFVIVGGLVAGTVVLSQIVGMVVEGELRGILGRRQLERKIANLSGHAIVCGFGTTGTMVVRELQAAGWQVVVVDNEPARTAQAQAEGLLYVLGDAQDEGTLEAAGIARARYLLSVLTGDAENVFVTLSARELNRELQIVVRAELPSTEAKLRKAGADRVVCPQVIGATRIAQVVMRPAVVDFVEMAHRGVDLEMEQFEVCEGSPVVGRPLAKLALPRQVGVQVVAVRRASGQTVYHPTSEFAFEVGDTAVLVGKSGAAAAMRDLCRPKRHV
jgi:voltage-gated potassium channel